ncbi:hypothetical protein DFR64_1308 [Pelolinea submarina]|uniref:Uncharacterized protein n=2 Tax=Pelolinea submarina TaxID=913107 RepID=A0A3E0AIE8_9CHLR|nr:hypothetical protein DFR64_1308 [Pelolinea submarina]
MGIILAAGIAACAKAPAIATETSIPTITPLPSVTPAPTATEDLFEDFSRKDCSNWREPCPATEEDLLSGRLIDYAKSVGQPFPEEAYNTGKIGYGSGVNGSIVGFYWNNIEGQPAHPEQELYRKKGSLITPYRWVPLNFEVLYNGAPYLISIQQWLNPDGSVSYLQYLVDRMNAVYGNGMSPSKTLFEDVGEVMPEYQLYGDFDFHNSIFGLSYNDKERETLIEKWVETGIIPEQLQYKILTPNIEVSDYTKKLP